MKVSQFTEVKTSWTDSIDLLDASLGLRGDDKNISLLTLLLAQHAEGLAADRGFSTAGHLNVNQRPLIIFYTDIIRQIR